jgi:YVTN family beta-propeller protein
MFCMGAAYAAPFAYISNVYSNDVSVIDTAANTVVATVPAGTNPQGVALILLPILRRAIQHNPH